MKIFVSWSGEASRRVAELLRKYLPCMLQDLEPFMSQHDLSSGGRWSEQLSKELESSNFGIICLTPDNLQNPWILFEAGALTKHVEGRACCLLLRGLAPTDVSGPLSQFQNRVFSKEGFQKLLADVNQLLDKRLESASLHMIFEKWWPDIDEAITAALADPALGASTVHKREQSDVLDELLLRIRSIQRAIESGPQEPALGFSQRSLKEVLDEVVRKLEPKQLALLREFVAPGGVGRVLRPEELTPEYSKADLEALLKTGLFRHGEEGVFIVHDLIAKYIDKALAGK